jgi:hypothetical protein
MYEPLAPRDVRAEERVERLDLPPPAAQLIERRAHDRPGWAVDEADTLVVGPDDPPHLRVGLLGRQVAPRLLVAVGLAGTTDELSGFVKARVVVSVNGGAALEERADVVVRGDAAELVRALAG